MRTVGRIWRQLLTLDPFRSGLLLFILAYAVRVAFIVHFHTYLDLSRTELERTALSLATKGVYGNPYAVPTGPTGHVAPGYTLILASIFRVFGTGTTGEWIKQLAAAVVPSLVYGLLPWCGEVVLRDRRAGFVAGLIGALYPARPLVETRGDWETPYTALILLGLLLATVRLWRIARWSGREALVQGLAWGVALLFVPALLIMFLAFVAAGAWFRGRTRLIGYLRFMAVEVIVAAICLSPWVIRNARSLGSPVVTRTNFGIELHVSNNDDATPDQRVNYLTGVFNKYHPLLSKPEALEVRQLGEVEYNRRAALKAWQWIRMNPRRFLALTLGRARCYWLYFDPTSLPKTVYLWLATFLGLAGLSFAWRRERISAAAMTLILIIYPLPNYLVHVGLRQEYPIHWLLMLLGVFFLFGICSTIEPPPRTGDL